MARMASESERAEFLAEIEKKEAEEAESFKHAVEEWRASKAAGGGDAKIVEAGGGFVDGGSKSAKVDYAVEVKHLDFSFSTGHETKEILRDMNMQLVAGYIFVLYAVSKN
jgi:hypothetical protein